MAGGCEFQLACCHTITTPEKPIIINNDDDKKNFLDGDRILHVRKPFAAVLARWYQPVDEGLVVVGDFDTETADVVVELLNRPRADDDGGHDLIRKHPGQRKLRRRDAS